MCALVTGVQTCALPICNPIVVINPLRERGLERFQNPQSPVEMVTLQDTQIASAYHLVKVGGDVALLKGIMKALLEADGKDLAAGGKGLLDRDFIAAHTTGFEARSEEHTYELPYLMRISYSV